MGTMGTTIIVAALIALAVGAGAAWVVRREIRAGRDAGRTEEDAYQKSLLLLQNQIENLSRAVDTKLGESRREMESAVRTQLSESQHLIRDITERLTQVSEGSRQVMGVAEQLRSLQNTLQNPKQRGVLGEYYLDTVLKNVLPPEHYQLQYKFSDGEIVDAVIFFDKTHQDKILPIDSKFSLENYNRLIAQTDEAERTRYERLFVQDIKNRIDETAKYIRPKEGTMDFAFMFIPSEAIYYDLLINKVGAMKSDLIEYAFHQKKVIIVSPTSFMAYLQTVLQGLRALQFEESAKEIQKRVGELGRHIGAYDQFMLKLGNSLSTTVNHYNTAHKELKKIDKDVTRIAGESAGVEPLSIDKPRMEEE